MDWIALLAFIISLILIGLFSGIEIAFVSVNKLSFELNKKQGTASGKVWAGFANKPTHFMGTMLVAFNIVLVIYGLLIGNLLNPITNAIEAKFPSTVDYVNYLKLFVESVIATFLILIVEFVFKAWFRARNNKILRSGFISLLSRMVYWLLTSFASFFINAAEWILKYIFNVKLSQKKDLFSKVDLENHIMQSKHQDEEETSDLNKELFENALSLSDVKLRECLIPRKEIERIEFNTPMNEVKKKFVNTQLSKLVVYESNIDNIIGYIHQLDLFKRPSSVKDILLTIPTVPESMSVTDMLNKFSKDRKTIAWVVDEFGGTAGIVTMEDLLEEIFGEIKDEYDVQEEFIDKQISTNEYIFSGRLELDFLREKYDLTFNEDEKTETLSGYIIQVHESIPRQKERIIIDNYEYDILSVSDTRIETVKLKVLN